MTDDRVEEVKKNMLSPFQWVRILYMVFYAVACWVLLFVLPAIIVCQVVIALITGEDNKNLRDFGGKLSAYFHSALDYLLYVEEDKPWPFENTDTDDDSDDEQAFRSSAGTGSESGKDGFQSRGAASDGRDSDDDVFADISFTSDPGDAETQNSKHEEDKPDEEGGQDSKPDEESQKP